MIREEHALGEVFAYRYPGENADHALLVLHGIASHGGIYDSFGAHHAEQGVDIWSMDAPGHGRSCISQRPGQFTLEQWVDAAIMYGEHIAEKTGLPVFVKGSSLGAAAAYCALAASNVFAGAILMGYLIPSGPLALPDNPFRSEAWEKIERRLGHSMRLDLDRFFDFDEDYGYQGASEQKHADPNNVWSYDMASWASLFRYDPTVPLSENTKPILYTVGENDPTFTPEIAQRVVDVTSGPTEFYIHPEGRHQLMIFHTVDYSKILLDWTHKVMKEGA